MVGDVPRAEQHAGEHGGVDHRAVRPAEPALLAGCRQECQVEGRVVGDDDAVARELEKAGQHLGDAGSAGPPSASVMPVSAVMWSGIGLPGFTSAENSAIGRPGLSLHRADLGDPGLVGQPSGRLDVDDDDVPGRQERAARQQPGDQPVSQPVAGPAFA